MGSSFRDAEWARARDGFAGQVGTDLNLFVARAMAKRTTSAVIPAELFAAQMGRHFLSRVPAKYRAILEFAEFDNPAAVLEDIRRNIGGDAFDSIERAVRQQLRLAWEDSDKVMLAADGPLREPDPCERLDKPVVKDFGLRRMRFFLGGGPERTENRHWQRLALTGAASDKLDILMTLAADAGTLIADDILPPSDIDDPAERWLTYLVYGALKAGLKPCGIELRCGDMEDIWGVLGGMGMDGLVWPVFDRWRARMIPNVFMASARLIGCMLDARSDETESAAANAETAAGPEAQTRSTHEDLVTTNPARSTAGEPVPPLPAATEKPSAASGKLEGVTLDDRALALFTRWMKEGVPKITKRKLADALGCHHSSLDDCPTFISFWRSTSGSVRHGFRNRNTGDLEAIDDD